MVDGRDLLDGIARQTSSSSTFGFDDNVSTCPGHVADVRQSLKTAALEAQVSALQNKIALQEAQLAEEKLQSEASKKLLNDLYQIVAICHHLSPTAQWLNQACNLLHRQQGSMTMETDHTCMVYLAATYLAFGGITDFRNPFVCKLHTDEITKQPFVRITFSRIRVLQLLQIPTIWNASPSEATLIEFLNRVCQECSVTDAYEEYTARAPLLARLVNPFERPDHVCSVRYCNGSPFFHGLERAVRDGIDRFVDVNAILSQDVLPKTVPVGDLHENYSLAPYHTIRDYTKPLQQGYGSRWNDAQLCSNAFGYMYQACHSLLYPEQYPFPTGTHVGVFWKAM